MKITLTLSGREKTFSENELVSILEDYFATSSENSIPQTAAKAKTPKNKNRYIVDLQTINRDLFVEERTDPTEESLRCNIQKAFVSADANPSKYGKRFETLIPNSKEHCYTAKEELYVLAYDLGDHIADWVEQCLEWAQRISDGEQWGNICDKPDTHKYQRLIISSNKPNKNFKIVGSYHDNNSPHPEFYLSDFSSDSEFAESEVYHTVPLVINYL